MRSRQTGGAILGLILGALAITTVWTGDAAAQGRCNCNRGCHAYPGQCVQGGSSGCEAGYAPFCGTRGDTCPNAGWVSCSGTCTCVRIPTYDAGVPDASVPPADAPPGTDVPFTPVDVPFTPVDVPVTPTDVPVTPTDVPVTPTDVPVPPRDVPVTPTDVPVTPTDVPTPPRDVPVTPTDVPVTPVDVPFTPVDVPTPPRDVPVTPTDAPVTPTDVPLGMDVPPGEDVPCACPGGVCLAGRCVTERCQYEPELGFLCRTPGTSCRLIDGEPYCVPHCLGLRCEPGEFCDESTRGLCATDNCSTTTCPAGLVCFRNRCEPPPQDASVALPDAGAPVDGGRTVTPTDPDGCGCRAGSTGRSGGGALLALLAALGFLRRARRR